MDLHLKLKNSTADAHDNIEKNPNLQKILSDKLTKHEYILILKKFLGFLRPLEKKLKLILKPELHTHLDKSFWLEQDLAMLNIPTEVEECSFANIITNETSALGALYVLEGSMLGGQLIYKHLKNFDFINPQTSNYYAGYKDQASEKWKSFLSHLTEFERNNPLQLEQLVQASQQTFRALDNWFLE